MSTGVTRNIRFFYTVDAFYFPRRKKVKELISYVLQKEGKTLMQLSYTFCSDEYVLALNKQYLSHDYYTDILTFDLSGHSEYITGDVYISVDRVRENAKLLNENFHRELLRVILHGVLHLCNYGDKTLAQKRKMRELEDYYLNYSTKA